MSMDGKQGTSQTMKTDEENVAKEIEEEMAFEITNEEKESENNRRLQILFHLLDLACAMVSREKNLFCC